MRFLIEVSKKLLCKITRKVAFYQKIWYCYEVTLSECLKRIQF